MNVSQLENNFLSMAGDFDAIISASKNELRKDKEDLQRKFPNGVNNKDYSKNGGPSFSIGGFEKETPKQRQMKEERMREYQNFLAEKKYRTNGMRSTTNNIVSSRNHEPMTSKARTSINSRKDFKNQIDQEYEELLKRKKKEEKDYRVQFDDINIKDENTINGKKVILFDNENEEDRRLLEFIMDRKSRGKSAETQKRLDVPRTMKTEGRSNSVPPAAPMGIFGGSTHSSLIREKQENYKRDLEEQIREKNLLRAKHKLKRLGRVTSDVDVTEIEIPDDKWALPSHKIHNTCIQEDSEESDSRKVSSDSQSKHNLYNTQQQQQYSFQKPMMQQPFYPPTQPAVLPMYQPVVVNPMMTWQNMIQPMHVAGTGYNTAMYSDMNPDTTGNQVPPRTSGKSSARTGRRKQWEGKVPQLDLNNTPPDTGYITSEKKKPLSNLSTRRSKQPPGGGSHGLFNLSPRNEKDMEAKRAKQIEYLEDLERQVQLKKEKEKKEKEEYERYQKKLDTEVEVYDPWGRGGCGAPVRSKDGKIVANLKALQSADRTPENKPYQIQQRTKQALTYDADIDDSPILMALAESLNKVGFIDTYKAAIAAGSPNDASKTKGGYAGTTYGRGAALKELKGINAMSPRDKEEQNEYKQFLKEQVETKKRKDEEAKEKARLEEEREAERIVEQQKRMHEEYEREKEQQRKKEEELRNKNEELRLAAGKKRFEEEQRQKKIKEEFQADLRKQAERKFEHHRDNESIIENIRSDSPPVPVVAKERRRSEVAQKLKEGFEKPRKQIRQPQLSCSHKVKSPDMEYLESIRQSMEHQTKVNETNFRQQKQLISQLSALREQLQKQEFKIQEELHNNKVKYTELHKDTERTKPRPNDIFAKATKKTKKLNVPEDNTGSILNNGLPYSYGSQPSTYKTLDLQQQEYMRQQEERLNNLKKNLHQKQPRSFQSRPSVRSLLDSDSKFISLRNHQDITAEIDSDDSKNTRYSSARSLRREKDKGKQTNDVFQENYLKEKEPDTVSIATYRVEEMAKRNEQRLKQFNINSHQDNEAENIVRKFMHESDRRMPSDSRFQP